MRSKINWRVVAFWGALWWFIYSAPTDDLLAHLFVSSSLTDTATHADDL